MVKHAPPPDESDQQAEAIARSTASGSPPALDADPQGDVAGRTRDQGDALPASDDAEALDLPITQLFQRWSAGSDSAEAEIYDAIYPSLHRIAANALRAEARSATLDTTDLLHESYLLLSQQRSEWQNRHHFFAMAARMVRRVLVDHARKRGRIRRGAGATHIELDSVHLAADSEGVLAIDQALIELAEVDASGARLVELRYFGGLSLDKAAEVMGCGRTKAVLTWRFARAWLQQRLASEQA